MIICFFGTKYSISNFYENFQKKLNFYNFKVLNTYNFGLCRSPKYRYRRNKNESVFYVKWKWLSADDFRTIKIQHKLNSGCWHDRLFRDFLKTVLRGFLGYSYFYYKNLYFKSVYVHRNLCNKSKDTPERKSLKSLSCRHPEFNYTGKFLKIGNAYCTPKMPDWRSIKLKWTNRWRQRM